MPVPVSYSLRNPASKFPLVVAMYTADRLHHALRLRESLLRLKLSHAICEIDAIHSTTSVRGNPNSAHAKPVFIRDWVLQIAKPVLYVDADTVFKAVPTLIFQASRAGCQFAIFNWLSGEDNQTYFPIPATSTAAPAALARSSTPPYATPTPNAAYPAAVSANTNHAAGQRVAFLKGFAVTHSSSDQILVSGAVQLWGSGAHARALLDLWHQTVLANPRSRDDHALDYSFNNFTSRKELRFVSLPRAYCRYGWWPHVRPVIDHPDVPAVNMPWEPLPPEFLAKRVRQDLLIAPGESAGRSTAGLESPIQPT